MKVLKSQIHCDYKRVEKSTQVQIIEQESKTAMHTSQITLEKIMHEYTRSNECQKNYVCE